MADVPDMKPDEPTRDGGVAQKLHDGGYPSPPGKGNSPDKVVNKAPETKSPGAEAACHDKGKPRIDPTAQVEKSVQFGKGAIVDAGATIASEAKVDACAHIGENVVVGPRVHIGANTSIEARAHVSYGTDVGQHVTIGKGAYINPASMDINAPGYKIGDGATIDPDVKIYRNVSAGEHVTLENQNQDSKPKK